MNYFIIFILLLILLILLALNIHFLQLSCKIQKNTKIQKNIYGGSREYDYTTDEIFMDIQKLIHNMLNDINDESLFRKCIDYKGVIPLLKNILLLSKKEPYGIYLELGDTRLMPSDMGVFISYYEPFIQICTFKEIFEEYEKFKITKQSYLIYWMNILNIFKILVRLQYDTKLSKYLDSDNKCEFDKLVIILIAALDCNYANVLSAYKAYIIYALCVNEDIKVDIVEDAIMYDFSNRGDYTLCVNWLLEFSVDNNLYLLLSAKSISPERFGMFEGIRFLISALNPYLIADGTGEHNDRGGFRNIVPVICHDLISHNAYNRKLHLTPTNEIEFKKLCELSVTHNYPHIFKLIFEIFHESNNDNNPIPFSEYMFISNCVSLLLVFELVNTSSDHYDILWNKSDEYETLSFIEDTRDINKNAEELLTFLLNCKYINEYMYGQIDDYIKNERVIFIQKCKENRALQKYGINSYSYEGNDLAPFLEDALSIYMDVMGTVVDRDDGINDNRETYKIDSPMISDSQTLINDIYTMANIENRSI